jgi:hypothetical protein
MASLNKYKTFEELKGYVKKSKTSKKRLNDLVKDLENFAKKIQSSQKKQISTSVD